MAPAQEYDVSASWYNQSRFTCVSERFAENSGNPFSGRAVRITRLFNIFSYHYFNAFLPLWRKSFGRESLDGDNPHLGTASPEQQTLPRS